MTIDVLIWRNREGDDSGFTSSASTQLFSRFVTEAAAASSCLDSALVLEDCDCDCCDMVNRAEPVSGTNVKRILAPKIVVYVWFTGSGIRRVIELPHCARR